MAGKNKNQSLGVWMNGELTGIWTPGKEHCFRYSDSWLDSPRCRSLSLSLPAYGKKSEYRGAPVEAFFDNLLPDSLDIRRRLQSQFHTSSLRAFELLKEIGKDCVGAVQLLPEGLEPINPQAIIGHNVIDSEIENQLKRIIIPTRLIAEEEGFRISLAGAQEKTAFLRHKGKWMIPDGPTPTTHIFKLPLGRIGSGEYDMTTSVENEWLCSRILHHFQIPAASCEIGCFGREKALIVERFDRRFSQDGTELIRLPQEDFCQATGRWNSQKYESDGGPGILEIMKFLTFSQRAEVDRATFFKAQMIFHLLAATDGHGKNFSIYLLRGDRFRLTPLYDVLSLHPVIGNGQGQIHPRRVKMAMALTGESGKKYNWDKITRRHWLNTARIAGFPQNKCHGLLDEIIRETPAVIRAVGHELPDDFPSSVAESIFTGMEKHLTAL